MAVKGARYEPDISKAYAEEAYGGDRSGHAASYCSLNLYRGAYTCTPEHLWPFWNLYNAGRLGSAFLRGLFSPWQSAIYTYTALQQAPAGPGIRKEKEYSEIE